MRDRILVCLVQPESASANKKLHVLMSPRIGRSQVTDCSCV